MNKTDNNDNKTTLEQINEKLISIESKVDKLNRHEQNKKETTFQAATLMALGFSMIALAIAFTPIQFQMTTFIKNSVFLTYFVIGFFFIILGCFHAIRKRERR